MDKLTYQLDRPLWQKPKKILSQESNKDTYAPKPIKAADCIFFG
jgi:hypothetical protein